MAEEFDPKRFRSPVPLLKVCALGLLPALLACAAVAAAEGFNSSAAVAIALGITLATPLYLLGLGWYFAKRFGSSRAWTMGLTLLGGLVVNVFIGTAGCSLLVRF